MCQSWFGRSHACFRHTRVPGRPTDIRPDGAPPTCRRLTTEGRGRPAARRRHRAPRRPQSISRARRPALLAPDHCQWCPVGRSSSMYQPRRRNISRRRTRNRSTASCRTSRNRFCRSVRDRAGHGRSRPVEAVGAGVPTTGLARATTSPLRGRRRPPRSELAPRSPPFCHAGIVDDDDLVRDSSLCEKGVEAVER